MLKRVVLIFIMVLMLTSGMTVIPACSSGQVDAAPEVGKRAPDFQLNNLDGQSVTLSSLQGKPVLLNFWASWCGPCRSEMPFLEEVHRKWSAQGLTLVVVNIGESSNTVRDFMQSNGYSFLVLLDKEQEAALIYNVNGIPATFFIDKDGIIRGMQVGAFPSRAAIENRLRSIVP